MEFFLFMHSQPSHIQFTLKVLKYNFYNFRTFNYFKLYIFIQHILLHNIFQRILPSSGVIKFVWKIAVLLYAVVTPVNTFS
jgi:hypothetical protein